MLTEPDDIGLASPKTEETKDIDQGPEEAISFWGAIKIPVRFIIKKIIFHSYNPLEAVVSF